MSSTDESDDDLYYEMNDEPIYMKNSKLNKSTDKQNGNEPNTPGDELDENFYQITDEIPITTTQAYIDEPLTPSDAINPNFKYTILTQDEYYQLMMKHVEDAKNILQLPESIIKILLNHFKWDQNKLLEEFYDKDREELFKKAKIPDLDENQMIIEPERNFCLICCSDEPGEMFSLQCNHTFCQQCWKIYLHRQINNEGLGEKISCPNDPCDLLVDDQIIKQFLGDDSYILHVYKKQILNSYVENNPRARWCPGKDCGFIVNATSLTSSYNYAQLIACSNCRISFCFQCAQPWHDPIKCQLLLEWNKKLFDENQTVLWIKANTKTCPKCMVNIEKNGGCNHMTCRHCKYEFCWLCFGKWSTHNECNRFNESTKLASEQAELAQAISRYIHYHDRFRNHEHSYDLENKAYRKFQEEANRRSSEIFQGDRQIVERAFDVLLRCRQMLTYTYPFAYYLSKNNQSIVFEDNQADVERACEELTRLLEKDVFRETAISQYRIELTKKYQYCEARKTVLLQHVKEGYIHAYWEYINVKAI